MNRLMEEKDSDLRATPEDLVAELTAMQPRLYGYILKRLANREHTLEVLQKTNLVICRKAEDFRKGSGFAAWAFAIAKFQVMAWRKSADANRLVFTDDIAAILDRESDDEQLQVDRRIPILRRCLEKLREKELELIQKRYRDGEQLKSIAVALSKSVDAISMKLARIRQRLATCVEYELRKERHHG